MNTLERKLQNEETLIAAMRTVKAARRSESECAIDYLSGVATECSYLAAMSATEEAESAFIAAGGTLKDL